MKPFSPPLAVDLLEQFVTAVRPKLANPNLSPKAQLQLFWSLARSSRNLASSDVWESEFEQLAGNLGLIRHRHVGADGVRHVLMWARRDKDPFE
jgi:hypothetical protein